jgi:hypothetical protein
MISFDGKLLEFGLKTQGLDGTLQKSIISGLFI